MYARGSLLTGRMKGYLPSGNFEQTFIHLHWNAKANYCKNCWFFQQSKTLLAGIMTGIPAFIQAGNIRFSIRYLLWNHKGKIFWKLWISSKIQNSACRQNRKITWFEATNYLQTAIHWYSRASGRILPAGKLGRYSASSLLKSVCIDYSMKLK